MCELYTCIHDITKRLRGQYACGPHQPNGDPEFGWRQFEATPINKEAADYIDALRSERDRLREALKPAAETKSAYSGEVSFDILDRYDEEGNPSSRKIMVPWTAIKDIMKMINAHASLSHGGKL